MKKLTKAQRRVLRLVDRGMAPRTLAEFEIYVKLKTRGYAGYSFAARGVQATDKGRRALGA